MVFSNFPPFCPPFLWVLSLHFHGQMVIVSATLLPPGARCHCHGFGDISKGYIYAISMTFRVNGIVCFYWLLGRVHSERLNGIVVLRPVSILLLLRLCHRAREREFITISPIVAFTFKLSSRPELVYVCVWRWTLLVYLSHTLIHSLTQSLDRPVKCSLNRQNMFRHSNTCRTVRGWQKN